MDPYLGEIRMFAGNYAPADWHICDGSLLNIQQYQALYSLLGIAWGGDGVSTFALPDLRGRIPVGQGNGPNLTPRTLGQKDGTSTVQIQTVNMPAHTHTVNASNTQATLTNVAAGVGLAQPVQATAAGNVVRYAPPTANPLTMQVMDTDMVTMAPGGSQPHDNLMPYLCINYIICASAGLYPDRP
ncbi:tail fiber protein [Azospirillum sp. SYSU D00513]|uniref:phage tail protein n=1 Tax=Azospirillum sp. SYSU D00513 TaxID=2812561 RepID=UPI001A96F095|nr:tail fiber protein [Azospirillum sp. SYSU D00513]